MRPALLGILFIIVFISMVGVVAYFPASLSAHPTETIILDNGIATDGSTILHTPFFTSVISTTSLDPTTYVEAVTEPPITLDPASANNHTGELVIQQVYEPLITYNGTDTTTFVPQLAITLPTISDEGLTYTFTIREGITFHEGGKLTAEDVAYSFQRGILQGGYDSPQYLLTEPLLGSGVRDVSELLFAADGIGQSMRGNREAVQTADPALLRSACEAVKSHIQADGDTVTFSLTNTWSPFLHILTGTGASVMDKEWVIENGGWDGDCGTWQTYYAIPIEENRIATHMNGTGPFQLDRVHRQKEVILFVNENYWRTNQIGPAWQRGPVGKPSFEVISIQVIPDVDQYGEKSYLRFAMMQASDVDSTYIEPELYSYTDELVGERCEFSMTTHRYTCSSFDDIYTPFRLYQGKPGNTRTDLLFNWSIADQPTNRFLGSGQLDGDGISHNFFSDGHVRRGFAYCFNSEPYIEMVLKGDAFQSVESTSNMTERYNLYGAHFQYDLTRCREALAQAWGGVLPTTGFRLQVPYRVDDDQTHTILTSLQAGLSEANPAYQLELVGVTSSAYAEDEAANRVPLFLTTWTIAIDDPYYWFYPALTESLPRQANIPETLTAPIRAKLNTIVTLQNPLARQHLYVALNQIDEKSVFALRLAIPLERHYEHRWVVSPGYPTNYFYELKKK